VRPPDAIRVLLSEGSSLSAREVISDLAPLGYSLHVCDPDPFCLARFSRYVRKVHRCPRFSRDPEAYLDTVSQVVRQERIDVLLPVHEQSYLFARVRSRLEPLVGLAVPGFPAIDTVLNKASFIRLLDELAIPHPPTRMVRTSAEILEADRFPYFVKTAYGASSQGVWLVGDAAKRDDVASLLQSQGLLDGSADVLVQDPAGGQMEMTVAVFDRGELIGAHSCRRLKAGVSGSSSAKIAVDRPAVRAHLRMIGSRLVWHGALALDYFYDDSTGAPAYIDANPRLVEPMNAALSGLSLSELMVRVSLAERPAPVADALSGQRTHMLLAALLGVAERGGSRRDVLRELRASVQSRGDYAGSEEELFRVRDDPPSLAPMLLVISRLLASPRRAHASLRRAASSLSLDRVAAARIAAMPEVPEL
jgi:predicted ATP-grasp superfamily ATP-dependent carboligase